MLVEVTKKEYRRYFPVNYNPFISEAFISINRKKQDKVIRLIREGNYSIGLFAGLKDGVLSSPFSAPFGGFHYSHEHLVYDLVYEFIDLLKKYVVDAGLKRVTITLPPDIYQKSMNAKMVNAFIRLGFKMEVPDLNNCVNLNEFDGSWTKSVVAQNCRKAIKNGLQWSVAVAMNDMEDAYRVIYTNREGLGRKIYMSLEDVLEVQKIFPVDFFIIRERDGTCVGGAVLYRGHESIVQGVFMGSDLEKRNLGIIDYMYMQIYDYYKELGFDYIDLGTASSQGEPNIGLLRFKEIHNSETSLKYTFYWEK